MSSRAAAGEHVIRVGRYDVEITPPAKVLFPADGITKSDLIEYYRRIAPTTFPHLRDRPLAMERYPDGIDGQSFFQKEVPSYLSGLDRESHRQKRRGNHHSRGL